MFDHITLTVRDYKKSRSFYEQILVSLHMSPLHEEMGVVTGYGSDRPFFWISATDSTHPISTNVHVAFTCESREQVVAFYTAALAAGARDNGAPGLRPEYHENYYAAFVLDLDGNNIEAVCGNSPQ